MWRSTGTADDSTQSTHSEQDREGGGGGGGGGLFGLTEIRGKERAGEKERQQKDKDRTASLQSRLVSTLNLSSYTTKSYTDYGPLTPGYNFYQLLLHSKNLEVPIPDTIIINESSVYHLYNGQHGFIEKSKPDFETTENFISKAMERFLSDSSTINPKIECEPLAMRTIGLVKKQLWKTHIMNHTETLSGLGVQAYLVQALRGGNKDSCVIQKFIKCRGRRPCFNRIFWKAGGDGGVGTTRTLAGWNISAKDDFGRPSPTQATILPSQKASEDPANNTSDATNIITANTTDSKYHTILKAFVEMNSSETAAIKLKDSQNYRAYGYRNICSLTDEAEDVVTPEHSETITITKLSPRAIEGTMATIDKIVQFLENFAMRKYGWSISVTEIVCDFIRDDADNLFLTQVKGLRFSPSSLVSIKNWIRHQDDDSDLDDEDQTDAAEEYRKKIRQAIERQKEYTANLCKLCGMMYPEGAQIVDLNQNETQGDKSQKEMLENENDQPVDKKAKKFPCYGYRITDRMAYTLAATFRDNALPLTPYAREMLLEEAQYSQVGLAKPPIALADGTQTRARRKRLGTVEVCFHCIKIFEKCCQHKAAADDLYSSLGVRALSSKKSQDSRLVVEGLEITPIKFQTRVPKNIEKGRTSNGLARQNLLKITSISPEIETHCSFHGQSAPWTSAHFESSAVEWRILIMFHNLLDVKCYPSHPLHNSHGYVSYSLGQSIQTLPFRNRSGDHSEASSALEVGNFASGMVSVRQCRLHYMYASKHAATELFASKRLEFNLFFSPNDHTANTECEELQLEATFFLDLGRLNWITGDHLTGREKIDVLIPIETKSLGIVVAKISVGIAHSESLPSLNEYTFYKERRCFWPPSDYHDTQPLPEAWIAMLTSKDRAVFKLQSNEGKIKDIKQLENAVLMLKYSNYIRKVFDDQKVHMNGTVNGPQFLLELYQTLSNEMTYLSEEDNTSLLPFQMALRGIIEDAEIDTRITFETFVRLVEKYINEPLRHTILEPLVDEDLLMSLKPARLQQSRQSKPRTLRLFSPMIPSLIDRLTHMVKTQTLAKTSSFDSLHLLEKSYNFDDSRYVESEMVGAIPSEERKKRRLQFLQFLFQAVGSDVIDIAELRQYLVEERDKLTRVLNLVKSNLMNLPMISADYEAESNNRKFSLVRSVLCAHLLSSSEKLLSLYRDYDTLGVSIISRVGLNSCCDACWRKVALTRTASELDPVIQELIWITKFREPNSDELKTPLSMIPFTCDIHGRGQFYLSDLCCLECEREMFDEERESEYT